MDRPSVYVSTHNARCSDAFTKEQVKQRQQRVATGVSLVEVFAHEELRCKKLRTLQHEEDVPVFRDLYGTPYKYTDAYTRADETVVSAYFSRFSGEGDGQSQYSSSRLSLGPSPSERRSLTPPGTLTGRANRA